MNKIRTKIRYLLVFISFILLNVWTFLREEDWEIEELKFFNTNRSTKVILYWTDWHDNLWKKPREGQKNNLLICFNVTGLFSCRG